jgi:hypothetical protein
MSLPPSTNLGKNLTSSSASYRESAEERRLLLRQQEINLQLKCQLALKDKYFWLTQCTETEDNQDAENPYKPFPTRAYMKPLLDLLDAEPVVLIEKSRTMMASWLVAGWCAHHCFSNPAQTVLFQSQDEDRAVNLVRYVKCLWRRSLPQLKKHWAVKQDVDKQAYNTFQLANGSMFIGVVGDPNKVRSLHPSVYVCDEAAFMTQFEEAWSVVAGTRVPKMIALSSVAPGPYWSLANEGSKWVDWV